MAPGKLRSRETTLNEEVPMTKVLVLYYSSWGHIEQMAYAAAEGAREAGADVVVKRVPELVPAEVAQAAHYKTDQKAPVATVDELPDYDAIIFGTPTRYGTMTAQMKNFLDQTGGLWAKGRLIGKVGSVFTSSATQHGGQEAPIPTPPPGLPHPRMVAAPRRHARSGLPPHRPPPRRPGGHDPPPPAGSPPPRHGGGGPALFLPGPVGGGPDQGRLALRRIDRGRRRRGPAAPGRPH